MEPSGLLTLPKTFAPPHTFTPFRRAAVMGAGTMGAQIAGHLANAGLEVELLDVAGRDEDKNGVVRDGLERARRSSPNPFFSEEAARRITTGNFDDDLERLSTVEWVIEAVVERLDVKQSLLKRIEAVVRPDTIVSTNTSGLPIRALVEGRSARFRARFLGTHFFNPPRYLKLLELVPSADTDPDVLARIAHFGRIHLGKGIVVAKDTPYFIGNRIGVYAMLGAIRALTERDYSIEEIDTLTGVIAGRPKSATFRTADLVGLDVLLDVATNLYEAVPHDESREAFRPPELLHRLVEERRLGQKSGAGFYRKSGRDVLSVDPQSLEYRPSGENRLETLGTIASIATTTERVRALYADEDRAGSFFRESILDLMGYAARRIPEVSESLAEIDNAMRWGFGWELGPFETWEVIGFATVLQDLRARDVPLPSWIEEMERNGRNSFYRLESGLRSVFVPSEGSYVSEPHPVDEISFSVIRSDESRVLWSGDEAALLHSGDGVALYEFRSKANTLGRKVMEGLREAIVRVEEDRDLKGLVIANDGKHFSAGANLGEVAEAMAAGAFGETEAFLREFQQTLQRLHYARKPVVVCVHQLALGGGCEVVMSCPYPVAAVESYVGLVELGAGLIPGGTGTMRLAALASERAPNGHPSEIQAWLVKFFQTVARGTVSTSAVEAVQLGFLPAHTRIVMNADRRFHVAHEQVLRLSHQGYAPPPVRTHVTVLGRPARAALEVMVQQYREGNFISEYDRYLAGRLAYIMTGGDLTGAQAVHEDYLLELEREVFAELLHQEKTRERIAHLLKTRKPLRN